MCTGVLTGAGGPRRGLWCCLQPPPVLACASAAVGLLLGAWVVMSIQHLQTQVGDRYVVCWQSSKDEQLPNPGRFLQDMCSSFSQFYCPPEGRFNPAASLAQ